MLRLRYSYITFLFVFVCMHFIRINMFSAASRFALRRAATTSALRTNVVQFQQPMFARNFAATVSFIRIAYYVIIYISLKCTNRSFEFNSFFHSTILRSKFIFSELMTKHNHTFTNETKFMNTNMITIIKITISMTLIDFH